MNKKIKDKNVHIWGSIWKCSQGKKANLRRVLSLVSPWRKTTTTWEATETPQPQFLPLKNVLDDRIWIQKERKKILDFTAGKNGMGKMAEASHRHSRTGQRLTASLDSGTERTVFAPETP